MSWRADDPGAEWGARLAGDRPHRYAARLSRTGAAGSGDAEARPAFRASVRIPRPARRSDQNHLARWARRLPVRQASGARPISVAVASRWRSDDFPGAVGVFARLPMSM